ncbi:MAG: signal recognition particle protein [Proteobacteria bacterium]|nr:signal recognition particle protein [Pseudomonadota bacterium]
MLETISHSFSQISKRLRGQARLTEENIQTAVDDIRTALIDADVALSIADDFINQVKQEALGSKIATSLNPGQAFIGIVHNQLSALMGDANAPLKLQRAPAIVLACGLQGVGKTTNLTKIAHFLKKRQRKNVLLAGMDIRRPAAIEQLSILAKNADIPCFESDNLSDAHARLKQALKQAQQELVDVLLIDTAGRTTLDAEMMAEIVQLHALSKPVETLFFIDALQGQDAFETTHAFAAQLPLTGLVITKFDGDSRGGSVLSAKAVTGQPIKFVGVGEKLEDLELFHPNRFASRLLGYGDIESLAEQMQDKTDTSVIQKLSKKIGKKPASFDLSDMLAQLQQMKKIGGIKSVLDKLPGNLSEKLAAAGSSNDPLKFMEAVILSMTPAERKAPDIIKASRRRRIAAGAAVTVAQVNQVLLQFEQTRKMMKKYAKNPLAMTRMMKQMF